MLSTCWKFIGNVLLQKKKLDHQDKVEEMLDLIKNGKLTCDQMNMLAKTIGLSQHEDMKKNSTQYSEIHKEIDVLKNYTSTNCLQSTNSVLFNFFIGLCNIEEFSDKTASHISAAIECVYKCLNGNVKRLSLLLLWS